MITKEVRIDMELISPNILAHYMDHRDYSVRGLAAAVTLEMQKRSKTRGRKCSHSTIGHLRRGTRSYCDKDVAPIIERLLDAPKGSLFVSQVSTVQRERGQVPA